MDTMSRLSNHFMMVDVRTTGWWSLMHAALPYFGHGVTIIFLNLVGTSEVKNIHEYCYQLICTGCENMARDSIQANQIPQVHSQEG